MAHVVPPDLPGRIRQTVRKCAGGGVEQQSRALDRVRRHTYRTRLLLDVLTALVGVDHTRSLSLGVVEYAQHLAMRPQVELGGGFPFGDLRVQRRPLGAALAAFEAEADLQAAAPSVARLRVDRHVAGVNLLVA